MKTYYFGYGMNTNIKSMHQRCPGAILVGTATLRNHKIVFKYHADVELAATDIKGVLWEVGAMEMQSLDYTEGYPAYYDRKEEWVEFNDRKLKAWVYYMAGGDQYAPPDGYYLAMITQGYSDAGIPLSQLVITSARRSIVVGPVTAPSSISAPASCEEWIVDYDTAI